MRAPANAAAHAANLARHAPIKATRDPAIAARVVAGETMKSIAADFGITRERVRQICGKQGVRTVRGKLELRAGFDESIFRLEVGIRAGLPFSMSATALAGLTPHMARLIPKLPDDIPSLVTQNARKFDRAACLKICKDEVFNRGGTITSAARRVGSSQQFTRQLCLAHPALMKMSKANKARLASEWMSKVAEVFWSGRRP